MHVYQLFAKLIENKQTLANLSAAKVDFTRNFFFSLFTDNSRKMLLFGNSTLILNGLFVSRWKGDLKSR